MQPLQEEPMSGHAGHRGTCITAALHPWSSEPSPELGQGEETEGSGGDIPTVHEAPSVGEEQEGEGVAGGGPSPLVPILGHSRFEATGKATAGVGVTQESSGRSPMASKDPLLPVGRDGSSSPGSTSLRPPPHRWGSMPLGPWHEHHEHSPARPRVPGPQSGQGQALAVARSLRGAPGSGTLSCHESILRRASSLPQRAEADSAGVLEAFKGALQSLQDVRMREEKLEGLGATAGLSGSRAGAAPSDSRGPGASMAPWAGQERRLGVGRAPPSWLGKEFPPGTRLARGRSAAWCGDGSGSTGDSLGAPRTSLRRQASAAAALALASASAAAPTPPLDHAAAGTSLGPARPISSSIFPSTFSPPRQLVRPGSQALGWEHPVGSPGVLRAGGGLPRPVRTVSLSLEHALAAAQGEGQAGAGEAGTARDVGCGADSSSNKSGMGGVPLQGSWPQGTPAYSGVAADTTGAAAPNSCAAGALTSHGTVHAAPCRSSALPSLPGPSEPPVVWCQWCLDWLFVPPKLPPPRKGVQKLRCGKCFRVCQFAAACGGPSAPKQDQALLSAHLSPGASSSSAGRGGAGEEESYSAAEQLIPWRSTSSRSSGSSTGVARDASHSRATVSHFHGAAVANAAATKESQV